MKVSPDEIQEFEVVLPEEVNSYDQINAKAIFYEQPIFQSEPNFSLGVVNPVTFEEVVVQSWTKNDIRSDPTIPKVARFSYDGNLYPEYQYGTLEVRTQKNSEVDILSEPIMVAESNKRIKNCVIDISFDLDPDVQEQLTAGGFYIPRVNTWRPDGQHVYFWRANTRTAKLIPIDRFLDSINYYGVDIFCLKTQGVIVTTNPKTELIKRPDSDLDPVSRLTQDKYALLFSSSASVKVRVYDKTLNFSAPAVASAQVGQPFSYDII